jgi:hypothetical protein
VTDCRLLKYEWVIISTGQDAELKAEKYENSENDKKIGVLKICDGERFANKYSIP